MLILTRRPSETVIIRIPSSTKEQEVKVHLVDTKGNQVRLGFTADPTISIHREEIQQKVDAETEIAHLMSKKPTAKIG